MHKFQISQLYEKSFTNNVTASCLQSSQTDDSPAALPVDAINKSTQR
jgi:hypothetical protein